MKHKNKKNASILDSMVIMGIGLAATYWILESLLYFFVSPQVNLIQQLLGSDIFEIWTRLLVLALFLIFGSHVQYTINKRKESDEARIASEEKYGTIIENIKEGVFECDLKGNFTYFNDSICRISGYSRKELLKVNYRKYTSPETARDIYNVFNHVYTTGEPEITSNHEIITKDDLSKVIEISVSLIRNNEGRRLGFRGVIRDVSERLEAEAEKRKLEKQFQQSQKMEAIGNLAGGIAHDFNNILMGMMGNTSLMLAGIESMHPHYQKLKNIEKYVQNGAGLTKQLLGFARGGKYEVKAIDLNTIIEKSSKMFGRTKKEINIQTDQMQHDLWTVMADAGQIEQVLLNLYINAWHAMPGGGDLRLKTENVILDRAYYKPFIVRPGKYVKMSVNDTGVGMDKATQERIFEPFFTTKEMGRGSGLGLASVYGIVKNHGGFINVYSEKGQGTSFNIYLPVSEEITEEEKEILPQIVIGTEGVLFVDDEEMILDIAKDLLEQIGYRVFLANSGKDAIKIYKENREDIDLVILDMVMPYMSGSDTFDALKKINSDIKVLLASGYSLNGQAEEILSRGCKGFIQKPFNMNQLSEKLRSILDE